MYANVRTWADLCAVNLDFLQFKHNETFYHAGPLDEETYENFSFLNDLIELNYMGIFTHSSQPGLNKKDCKQKSYLDFCCEKELAYELLPRLMDESNSGEIFFSFHSADTEKPVYIDTFPEERYNLTKYFENNENDTSKWNYYTNWNKISRINNGVIAVPNICEMTSYAGADKYKLYDILIKTVDISIACKEYDEDFSAPEKLLDIIKMYSKDLSAVD